MPATVNRRDSEHKRLVNYFVHSFGVSLLNSVCSVMELISWFGDRGSQGGTKTICLIANNKLI